MYAFPANDIIHCIIDFFAIQGLRHPVSHAYPPMWQHPQLQPPYYFKAPPTIPLTNAPHPRGPSIPQYRSPLNPYSIPFTPPQVRFFVQLHLTI